MTLRTEFHFTNFIPALVCVTGAIISTIGRKKAKPILEAVGFGLNLLGFCLIFVFC